MFRHPVVSRIGPVPLPPPPIVYAPDFYVEPMDIRRQLFRVDPANKMFPRYAATPDIQREVVNRYASVHSIGPEKMVEFWCDYVDALVACHNFEEEASPEFKAWAYGRLCRYVLLHRRNLIKANAYDPMYNAVLR